MGPVAAGEGAVMAGDIRRLFAAGAVIAVMAVSAEARADFETGNTLYAEVHFGKHIRSGALFGICSSDRRCGASARPRRGPRLHVVRTRYRNAPTAH
jgi:hypothetical protein